MNTSFLFVSYARSDSEIVHRIINKLELLGVSTWMDVNELRPGDRWGRKIQNALQKAVGMLIFISRASIQSLYVQEELKAVARGTNFLIIPVILEHVPSLPDAIKLYQWIDLSGGTDEAELLKAAREIENAVHRVVLKSEEVPKISESKARRVASEVADQVRVKHEPPTEQETPETVFIVHGRDLVFLDQVESYIFSCGIKPIVLTKITGAEQSLLQKFFSWAGKARFAIVLLSADDIGASRLQYDYEGGGDKALRFRARQNVVLELGFFYGSLGWENVWVLYKPAVEVFPDFERPSDLDGVIFDRVDVEGQWKEILAERLQGAGFEIRKHNEAV